MNTNTDPRIGVTHNRALCCGCGDLRLVASNFTPRMSIPECPASDEEHFAEIQSRGHYQGGEFGHRLTGLLKCAHCGVSTRHAILRDCSAPEHRDHAENEMYGVR